PLLGFQTGATKITVSGTYKDLDPSTLALSSTGPNGGATLQVTRISDTSGSYAFSNVVLATGEQTLTVTARNLLNQTTTSSVKVTAVSGAPAIAIDQPAD